MSLLTPTLTAAERPQPAERMAIPRSVWGVGLLMAGVIVALVEGLALAAPDPRPVEDLRAVLSVRPAPASDATNLQAMPVLQPEWVVSSPKVDTTPAPWAAAALPPSPMAMNVSSCGDCGVVESVKLVPRTPAPDDTAAPGIARRAVAHGEALGAQPQATARPAVATRSATVYRVRVRMDDGSLRTLTQRRPPVIGARVVVAGRTLRPARGEPATPVGA